MGLQFSCPSKVMITKTSTIFDHFSAMKGCVYKSTDIVYQ